jgi:hypothetical protein
VLCSPCISENETKRYFIRQKLNIGEVKTSNQKKTFQEIIKQSSPKVELSVSFFASVKQPTEQKYFTTRKKINKNSQK